MHGRQNNRRMLTGSCAKHRVWFCCPIPHTPKPCTQTLGEHKHQPKESDAAADGHLIPALAYKSLNTALQTGWQQSDMDRRHQDRGTLLAETETTKSTLSGQGGAHGAHQQCTVTPLLKTTTALGDFDTLRKTSNPKCCFKHRPIPLCGLEHMFPRPRQALK